MNPVAVIFKINNGYLVTTVDGDQGEAVYLKEFSLALLAAAPPMVDHEAALRVLVFEQDGNAKITAIKAVRDYCINKNYDKYRGLKDAKDYVERIRTDWYYGSNDPYHPLRTVKDDDNFTTKLHPPFPPGRGRCTPG